MSKSKPADGQRHQHTIQALAFATKLHREVVRSLKENPTVVSSAALVAFSKLPPAEQLEHITATRRRLLEG